jgi:predicted transcriptional regulator
MLIMNFMGDDGSGTSLCALGTIFCAADEEGEVITPEGAYQKLWGFLVQKLEEKSNQPGWNQKRVAELIQVPAPTVSRWINGVSGQEVKLISVITIMLRLGVKMEEIISLIAPGQAAQIAKVAQERPALFKLVLEIIEKGDDEDMAQLENYLRYIKGKIKEE